MLRAGRDGRLDDEAKAGRDLARRRGDAELTEDELQVRRAREERRLERDARTETLRAEARAAVDRVQRGKARGAASSPRVDGPKPLDRITLEGRTPRRDDEGVTLARLLGAAEGRKALRKLRAASQAFEAERFAEARRALKPLSELAPQVPEVRELYGVTLYRLGLFRDAAKQLEAFRELAASPEQNPVLADCYRALGRHRDVEALWTELAAISPGADLVNEGRIVMAGSLADRGELDQGVRLLEKGWKRPSAPREHHLRRAYALADLYERSGDVPRARALFDWIVAKAPDFVDARQRLRTLR